MRHELLFSGFGGQGIILASVIVGRAAAIHDRKHVVQTQVYGPEARGGASMGGVIIDDEPIHYPKLRKPGIYLIMSQEAFERYGINADAEAFMLLDSDLVKARPVCRHLGIPATSVAKNELGRVIVANIVMIGALAASTGVVSAGAIEKATLESVPKGTEELNLKALRRGMEIARAKEEKG